MPEQGGGSESDLKFTNHLAADESRQGGAAHALPLVEADKALKEKFGQGLSAEELLRGSKHDPDGQAPADVVVVGGADAGTLLDRAYESDKTLRLLKMEKHSYSRHDLKSEKIGSSLDDKLIDPFDKIESKADRALVTTALRQITNFKGSPAERFWTDLISSAERSQGENGGGSSFVGELNKIAERAKKEGRGGDGDYVRGLLVSQMAEMGAVMMNDLRLISGEDLLKTLPANSPELVKEFLGTKIGRERELLEVGEALGLIKDVVSGGEKRGPAVRAIQERFQRYFSQPGFEDVWQDRQKNYLMPVNYDREKNQFSPNDVAVKGVNEKVREVVSGLNQSLAIGQFLSGFEVIKGMRGREVTPVFLPHWPWDDQSVWQPEQAKLAPEERGLPFVYVKDEGQFVPGVDSQIVRPEHPLIREALDRLRETIPDLVFVKRVTDRVIDEKEVQTAATKEAIGFIQGEAEVVAVGDVKMWTNGEIAEVVRKMRENKESGQIGAEVDGKALFLELESMKKLVRGQLPDGAVAKDLKFILVVPADAEALICQEFADLAKDKGQEIIMVRGLVDRQTADRVANYVMTKAGINIASSKK